MRTVYSLLSRAAESDATVLLEGETGTGKEVTAQSIHENSGRAGQPFIVVDCGAIPGQLLESELFGYERGAFTGASSARAGAFEAANGGTIFLDEIGELEIDLQPKILRALESRRVKRLGTSRYNPIDVRVIAATNRNLREEVKAGRFRSDLYYRLAVLPMRLPPVRERRDDIPMLVDAILHQLGKWDSPGASAVRDPDFQQVLADYRWPGNVRQLRNYIERRLALGKSVPLPGADSLFPPNPGMGAPTSPEPPRRFDAITASYPVPTGLTAPPTGVTAQPPTGGMTGPPTNQPSMPPGLAAPPTGFGQMPPTGPGFPAHTPWQGTPLLDPSGFPAAPGQPSYLPPSHAPYAPQGSYAPPPSPEVHLDLPLKLAREAWNAVLEARYLEGLLLRHENNVTAAARAAGVNRAHFYRLLWKHGLRESEGNSK